MGVRWEVDTRFIESWIVTLDRKSIVQVRAALEKLAVSGPNLGRPLVDSIKGSKHHNMKELRPGSSGRSELRILFAFDPARAAITLLGGDKQKHWNKWYEKAIKVADALFDEHLKELKEKENDNG